MSGNKLELLWSPCLPDHFITYGPSIHLYRVENVTEGNTPKGIQIAEDLYGISVGNNTDIPFLKCVAWYPRPEPEDLLAVAQTNGKVTLTCISCKTPADELVGKEFSMKHARQCNFLSWNPSECNLLAQGLERHRNDPSIVIWDVNASLTSDFLSMSERSRHSYSEPGTITKPHYELAPAESASSFSWFVSDSKTFVAGLSGKALRMYDLRDTSRPQQMTSHKCVYGVSVDPFNTYRLASFAENMVALWDTRNFEKPIMTYQESKPVMKIGWCPTKSFHCRRSALTVLCKESSSVKIIEFEQLECKDDAEPAVIERLMQPFANSNVASFAWHLLCENRVLHLSTTGQLREVTVFDRIPVMFSPFNRLVWSYGKKLVDLPHFPALDDISERMRQRAVLGYGLQQHNVWQNALIIQPEPRLLGLWRWLAFLQGVPDDEASAAGGRSPLYLGIKGLLRLDLYPDTTAQTTPQPCYWVGVDFASPIHQYCNPARKRALQLCGWSSEQEGDKSLDQLLRRLQDNGEYEKAAALAIFNLQMGKALTILGNAQTEEGKAHLNAVAMALSGYGNQLWQRTCNVYRSKLHSPYLRAIFAFLASSNEDVLKEQEMEVSDRVAFACTYLDDFQLKDYIAELTNELKKTGNLDGLLLIGMSHEGVNLLERYVDLTGDIQTAALAAVYAYPPEVKKDDRVLNWIQNYTDLLDRWRMWHHRAKFDIMRHGRDTMHRVPPQGFVSCNFCGKSITSNMSMRVSYQPVGWSASHKPKVTCCPNCRKSLPRCDLCLTNLGTPSGTGIESSTKDLSNQRKLSNFNDWFTWCQTCRHGGHTAHVMLWFKEHSECPVTSCECKCLTTDAMSLLEDQSKPSTALQA